MKLITAGAVVLIIRRMIDDILSGMENKKCKMTKE